MIMIQQKAGDFQLAHRKDRFCSCSVTTMTSQGLAAAVLFMQCVHAVHEVNANAVCGQKQDGPRQGGDNLHFDDDPFDSVSTFSLITVISHYS